jgi:hypothetical protein
MWNKSSSSLPQSSHLVFLGVFEDQIFHIEFKTVDFPQKFSLRRVRGNCQLSFDFEKRG